MLKKRVACLPKICRQTGGKGSGRRERNTRKEELFNDVQGRVLEVGAGIGVNVFFLNKPEVTEWIAVEPDDKLTPECRSMLEVMGDRAKVFEGYLHDLNEKPNSFDCVILTTLLCSVPDPAEIVRDAHKMLKKGGKLYIIEHMGDSLGLRAAFQVTAKLPWKWTTGCNCRNNPIPALSQPGLWAEEVKLENAPLRLKKFSLMVELLKPFGMATLTKV